MLQYLFFVFLLLLIIFIIILFNKQKETGTLGIIYGKDLFFLRSEHKRYMLYCKYLLDVKYDFLFNNARKEGFDIEAIKAIIIWETGWLSDIKAFNAIVGYNNILGIMKNETQFRFFNNVNECLDFFVYKMVLSMKRYEKAKKLRNRGKEFLKALFECGYNPNIEWLEGVLKIYDFLLS